MSEIICHLAVTGLHVDLTAAQRAQQGTVHRVHKVPALLADNLDKPVVARGAVPTSSSGGISIITTSANDELSAVVILVVRAAETLPDSLPELQILHHKVVHRRFQLLHLPLLRAVKIESGLDREKEIHLRVFVGHDIGVSLAERHDGTVVLQSVVHGFLHHRDFKMPQLGVQVVHIFPLLHARDAVEQTLHHSGVAPVLGGNTERLKRVVFCGDGGDLDGRAVHVLVHLHQDLSPIFPGEFAERGKQQGVRDQVGEGLASIVGSHKGDRQQQAQKAKDEQTQPTFFLLILR
mmetsp:Transcript_42905/g.93278  ORF Transcript_42905/g.93278 Transcript_42905/m.93278 type:complete len:292 (-) Transcript_42905:44-919(-)